MSGITAPSDRTYSLLRILLSVYFLICVLWFVVSTAHWKLVNDAAQIHYVCFLMDHGMAPYRDILEVNWPGTYLVNWAVMHTLGAGGPAWRIFDLALMGMSCWAMVAIARPYDWFAGVLGAALFILFHGRDGAGQRGPAGSDHRCTVFVRLRLSLRFVTEPAAVAPGWLSEFVPAWRQPLSQRLYHSPSFFWWVVVIRLKRDGEPILKPGTLYALGLADSICSRRRFPHLLKARSPRSGTYCMRRCPFTTRLEVLLSQRSCG